MEVFTKIEENLEKIYGKKKGKKASEIIINKLKNIESSKQNNNKKYFDESDIFLITYGDNLEMGIEEKPPLHYLKKFSDNYLKEIISSIHILPFFPYSSDDGFSIIDYYQVDPDVGNWENIDNLNENFNLMFDFVCNHISAESEWFEDYLSGIEEFKNLAIEVDPEVNLSEVVRPRAKPLLTKFEKDNGKEVFVWTTFSPDQIDLNYKSLDILEKMIDVFIFYIKQGASTIRLDAIAYLWKKIGTKCIHLPEVHYFVKILRLIIEYLCNKGIIITETNVPHQENISYFGNGKNEAQMVYNFTLPPLILYSFLKNDVSVLNSWAKKLKTPSDTTTFFNFTASHDGIGVRPLEGIIPEKEMELLINHVKKNNGYISYKSNKDGTKTPYELNITYVDAMKMQNEKRSSIQINRFLASQAIPLVIPGVPAIYIHSLIGSRNWNKGVKKYDEKRKINREKLNYKELIKELETKESFRNKIFIKYKRMLKIRKNEKAFHPNGSFKIFDVNNKIFCVKRKYKNDEILSLINISDKEIKINIDHILGENIFRDLLTDILYEEDININPFQILWLKKIVK